MEIELGFRAVHERSAPLIVECSAAFILSEEADGDGIIEISSGVSDV
jgi:hypothetical protein